MDRLPRRLDRVWLAPYVEQDHATLVAFITDDEGPKLFCNDLMLLVAPDELFRHVDTCPRKLMIAPRILGGIDCDIANVNEQRLRLTMGLFLPLDTFGDQPCGLGLTR